jgi:uncharacterized small protein (DUF1192 family)
MEKELPRRQTLDELQRQYESKLRESKRQRSQVEEELESVSERWRTERRRLTGEIERLEASLAEAREARKKVLMAKNGNGIDLLDVAKIQSNADEKVRKASKSWDVERDRLLKEISRLQRAVGDLIERSNNPLRASMPVREELEAKLTEANRVRERIEAGYMREKAAWDEEKLRMTADLIKARNAATQSKTVKSKLGGEERATELENRIGAMQKEVERERSEWRAQIQQLERQLADTHPSVNTEGIEQLRRQYDERFHEVMQQKTQLADELKVASALLESDRNRYATASKPENTSAVQTEVERVQKMISEIGRKIDDPSTDLSTVIRKNVERAELNAYLRGIEFTTGNGRAI